MILRYTLVTCLICGSLQSFAQNQFCATIIKSDHQSELRSSHSAIIDIDQTLLQSITWIDSTEVNSSFFGSAIFYGDACTFNDTIGLQYRVVKIKESDNCFEMTNSHECKKILANSTRCRTKTDSNAGYCWKH